MKAYVLMQVEPAKARQIVKKVRGRGSGGAKCVSSELVTGPYDIVCVCQGPNLKAISECVLDCCTVQGVQRTTTCLVA